MQLKNLPAKIILLLSIILLHTSRSFAQLPVCTDTGGILYYDDGSYIYTLDPNQPVSATNPVRTIPFGGLGLAVGSNINAATPALTFYTTIGGYYYYYDGSNWINTGHKASTVNIGAGGGYIYGIIPGIPSQVYVYDGTGNDALLLTIQAKAPCLYDIIADCEGNFYVLNPGMIFESEDQWMRKYSPTGSLLHEWHLKGVPLGSGGGGFGIIDNTVFFDDLSGKIYKGIVDGDTLDFSVIATLSARSILDMGNCPKPLFSSTKDTVFYCGNSGTITANGTAPYTYTVVGGTPKISGNGPDFTVTSPDIAEVILHSHASACGNDRVTDTFIIVPPPVISAGPDDTVEGCAHYMDTLQGNVTSNAPWVSYDIQWSPAASITSGVNTLQPVIQPNGQTDYIMTVSTGAEQGNCVISDTVSIAVSDRSVTAAFSFDIHYGCSADTVIFTSGSSPEVAYQWDLGDGHFDTVVNPVHIYPIQDTYTVLLNITNNLCADSALQQVNTAHPLTAAFSMDRDTICVNNPVSFSNQSIFIHPDSAHFLWNFGDGTNSFDRDAIHQYKYSGTYTVSMMVTDFVPCTDTAYGTIIVDSISKAGFLTDKDNICTGQVITFFSEADQTAVTMNWSMGDGIAITNQKDRAIKHAYDLPGTMPVTLSTNFRACPDTSFTDTIYVYAFPKVYLGPDTSLCPQGAPILLENFQHTSKTARYLWNTGDTMKALKVTRPGTYRLTVSESPLNCSTTESIEIKKDCYIDVPNAFTPNGDGENDYFFPRPLLSGKVTQFKMQVFNRWGQLIFETTQARGRGWDGKFNGKAQPEGVYLYIIDATINGALQEHYQGNLTLLR